MTESSGLGFGVRKKTRRLLLRASSAWLAMLMASSPEAIAQRQAGPEAAQAAAIERINHYRELLKLPHAQLDPALSAVAQSHARYLVENHIDATDAELANGKLIENLRQDQPHHEVSDKPFYTHEAARLASRSIVVGASRIPEPSQVDAYIDEVMTKPFDALVMLNPQMVLYGAGSYCDGARCRIVMLRQAGMTQTQFGNFYRAGTDVYWFRTTGDRVWFTPRELKQPIEFPPAEASIAPGAFDGSSFPPALGACEGYSPPTGRPIFVALGAPSSTADQLVRLGQYSVSSGGSEVPACGFDAQSFYQRMTNNANRLPPDQRDKAVSEAELAAQILAQSGAVMVIPREPLQQGRSYQVSITADERPFTWPFEVVK